MSKGFTLMDRSLHHDFAGHLWVNRAEIFVGPRLAESERKLFVRIQHFGFEHFVGTNRGWWNIVAICPGNGCSRPDRKLCRSKTEIVDLHLGGIRFFLRAGGETSSCGARTRGPYSNCCE